MGEILAYTETLVFVWVRHTMVEYQEAACKLHTQRTHEDKQHHFDLKCEAKLILNEQVSGEAGVDAKVGARHN